MADAICRASFAHFKSLHELDDAPSPTNAGSSTYSDRRDRHSFHDRRLHDGIASHQLLTPDIQVRLLTVIDETGAATLGDLTEAIPDHPHPVAAVLALVDAGLAALDPAAPFDSHLQVWRTARD